MSHEDHSAIFLKWLEEHSASVVKVARAYTLSNEDCQDLAQEILLQAWRSVPRFSGRASPATWFYRVALHTAMNWHRKDLPRRQHQRALWPVTTVPTPQLDSSEQVERRELLERLYAAIHQLPRADIALVLLYLDDLSYREIAGVLGVSESNVGVKLNRAKTALARLMNAASREDTADES